MDLPDRIATQYKRKTNPHRFRLRLACRGGDQGLAADEDAPVFAAAVRTSLLCL
jgi:hypothetical protein